MANSAHWSDAIKGKACKPANACCCCPDARHRTLPPFYKTGDKLFAPDNKNIDDKTFEKHQVLETSINDAFRIEKADINKNQNIYTFFVPFSMIVNI